MLVCNVSMRPQRLAIAADVAEIATAADTLGTGNIVFATLVDDPASVNDNVDAYLGEIMLEAASAADAIDVAFIQIGEIVEVTIADAAPDATVTGASAGSTWNPSDKDSSVTLSGGNLIATGDSSASYGAVRGTKSITAGKAYLELTFTYSIKNYAYFGVATGSRSLSASGGLNAATSNVAAGGQIEVNGAHQGFLDGFANFASGDVLCVALDLTNQRIWFRRNAGTWNDSGTADPATNTGGFDVSGIFTSVTVFPWAQFANVGPVSATLNAGGSSFAQTVPSGFVSWNSA